MISLCARYFLLTYEFYNSIARIDSSDHNMPQPPYWFRQLKYLKTLTQCYFKRNYTVTLLTRLCKLNIWNSNKPKSCPINFLNWLILYKSQTGNYVRFYVLSGLLWDFNLKNATLITSICSPVKKNIMTHFYCISLIRFHYLDPQILFNSVN